MEKEPNFIPEIKDEPIKVEDLNSTDLEEPKINLNSESLEIEEKDNSKSMLLMILVICGIFILIFGGFYLYNQFSEPDLVDIDTLHQENIEGNLNEEEGYVYNGFSFIKADGLWWTELTRFDTLLKVPLRFGPKDLENITSKGQLDEIQFNNGSVVFVSLNDPGIKNKYYSVAISELQSNIQTGIKRIPIGACAEPDSLCENLTIINCQNNSGMPVIELDPTGVGGIIYQGSCIKITGENDSILRAVDYLILKWYGIME